MLGKLEDTAKVAAMTISASNPFASTQVTFYGKIV